VPNHHLQQQKHHHEQLQQQQEQEHSTNRNSNSSICAHPPCAPTFGHPTSQSRACILFVCLRHDSIFTDCESALGCAESSRHGFTCPERVGPRKGLFRETHTFFVTASEMDGMSSHELTCHDIDTNQECMTVSGRWGARKWVRRVGARRYSAKLWCNKAYFVSNTELLYGTVVQLSIFQARGG